MFIWLFSDLTCTSEMAPGQQAIRFTAVLAVLACVFPVWLGVFGGWSHICGPDDLYVTILCPAVDESSFELTV